MRHAITLGPLYREDGDGGGETRRGAPCQDNSMRVRVPGLSPGVSSQQREETDGEHQFRTPLKTTHVIVPSIQVAYRPFRSRLMVDLQRICLILYEATRGTPYETLRLGVVDGQNCTGNRSPQARLLERPHLSRDGCLQCGACFSHRPQSASG